MTDSSKIPVGEWSRWSEHPPQLGQSIVFVEGSDWIWPVRTIANAYLELGDIGLFWRPTGIYREEYFSVTGQWK